MAAAQRNGEFITDFAPECSHLGKAEMVSIDGPAAADEAGVLGDGLNVLPIANPARLR